MGRFLKRIALWFKRGRRIEAKVDSLKGASKLHRIEVLNEISALQLKLEAIEVKLDKLLEQTSAPTVAEGVTAKQLLDEYLYGENGDE